MEIGEKWKFGGKKYIFFQVFLLLNGKGTFSDKDLTPDGVMIKYW